MRVLGPILLLLGLLALAWYLLGLAPAAVDPGAGGAVDPGSSREQPAEIPAGPANPESTEAQRLLRELDPETWAASRNPLEALVPDPDGIGPCPPAHLGGGRGLVVQRYLERRTGVRFWLHDDRSFTALQYQYGPEPATGEQRGRWMIYRGEPAPTLQATPPELR